MISNQLHYKIYVSKFWVTKLLNICHLNSRQAKYIPYFPSFFIGINVHMIVTFHIKPLVNANYILHCLRIQHCVIQNIFTLHTISISITVGLLFPKIKLVKSKIWVIENMTNSFQMQDNQAWRIYVVI